MAMFTLDIESCTLMEQANFFPDFDCINVSVYVIYSQIIAMALW